MEALYGLGYSGRSKVKEYEETATLLARQVNKLKTEKETLTGELQDLRREIEETNILTTAARDASTRAEDGKKEAEEARAAAEAARAVAEQEKTAATEEKVAAERDAAEAQELSIRSQQEAKVADANAQRAREELQVSKAQLQELQERIQLQQADFETRMEQNQSAITQLEATNRAITSELEGKRVELATLGENVTRIQTEKETLQRTFNATKEDLQKEIAALSGEHGSIQENLTKAYAELIQVKNYYRKFINFQKDDFDWIIKEYLLVSNAAWRYLETNKNTDWETDARIRNSLVPQFDANIQSIFNLDPDKLLTSIENGLHDMMSAAKHFTLEENSTYVEDIRIWFKFNVDPTKQAIIKHVFPIASKALADWGGSTGRFSERAVRFIPFCLWFGLHVENAFKFTIDSTLDDLGGAPASIEAYAVNPASPPKLVLSRSESETASATDSKSDNDRLSDYLKKQGDLAGEEKQGLRKQLGTLLTVLSNRVKTTSDGINEAFQKFDSALKTFLNSSTPEDITATNINWLELLDFVYRVARNKGAKLPEETKTKLQQLIQSKQPLEPTLINAEI